MPSLNEDSRLKKSAGESREDRAMKDRPITENRQLTDKERAEAYRKQFYKTHLPDLPPIKGFHVCWVSTNNPSDTVQYRMRLGYVPIRITEVPGFEHLSVKAGEWVGCVGVNEMIAMKIPKHLAEEYHRYSHHDAPLDEERGILEKVQADQQEGAGVISNVQLFEGTKALGKGPAAPSFLDE